MQPAAAPDPAARPAHVAIITDGNGRWARRHGLSVLDGHLAGADTLRARLRDAAEFGIRELTAFSFSTENWSRPAHEVAGLMELFTQRLRHETPLLHADGVRVRFIGRLAALPPRLREQVADTERLTAANSGVTLVLAFNYGGRAEIVDAARTFQGGTEEEFRAHLASATTLHDPDLVIRTSGERRLSNFLLWQSAGAELMFTDVLWPDFDREAFEDCLAAYAVRRAGRAVV